MLCAPIIIIMYIILCAGLLPLGAKTMITTWQCFPPSSQQAGMRSLHSRYLHVLQIQHGNLTNTLSSHNFSLVPPLLYIIQAMILMILIYHGNILIPWYRPWYSWYNAMIQVMILVILIMHAMIPYFLVIRRILLISAYSLLSACHFPDLSTRC